MNDAIQRAQQEKLARWLFEWQMDRELAAVEDAPGDLPYRAKERAPDMPLLSPGSIVLFQPATSELARAPLTALTAATSAGTALFIPFGRFQEPAFGGEMPSGLEPAGLRILCPWLAFHAGRGLKVHVWDTCEILEAPLKRALALAHRPLEELLMLNDASGPPPIRHPLDPRRDYIEEERERMRAVLAPFARDDESTLLKAAEFPDEE
jgi:hypothetical protein